MFTLPIVPQDARYAVPLYINLLYSRNLIATDSEVWQINICHECLIARYITDEANRVAQSGLALYRVVALEAKEADMALQVAKSIRGLAQGWHARCKRRNDCLCKRQRHKA